jgi:diadenosine tetraphosphate (Ap4A) HIT family hydrolase
MPYYRSPKVQALYDALSQEEQSEYPFCKLDPTRNIIEEQDTYYIVENLMTYDLWDLHKVDKHLLLIPKVHVGSISELDNQLRDTLMEVMCRYESSGYNIYARAAQNKTKSVVHQHTHLIKTFGPKLTKMTYIEKPYSRELEFEN